MTKETYYSAVRMPKSVIDRAHSNGLCAAKVCVAALNATSTAIEQNVEKNIEVLKE